MHPKKNLHTILFVADCIVSQALPLSLSAENSECGLHCAFHLSSPLLYGLVILPRQI